ncbi:hypothetical protein H0N96_00570 [Candidatus Micrarchaeota archaeon]|nr:hypothetical protein [Candidatus Micrarchaeota archaeon]
MRKGYLNIVILAVIVAVFLLAFTVLPKQQMPVLTKDDVEKLLLKDLLEQNIPVSEVRVLNLNKAPEGDVWTATVIIARNQHSRCPTVEKWDYSDALRFKYRPEMLINDCNQRASIALREEALINSGKSTRFAAITGANDAFGCAFENKKYDSAAAEYCPPLDETAFNAFATDLPLNAWIVYWTGANQTAFIALSPQNEMLKTS